MEKKSPTPAHYVVIDEAFSGQRIDNFLTNYLKNVPKTHIYRILRKGEVRVNKKRIQASYRLQAGDSLRIPPLRLDVPKSPPKPSQGLKEKLSKRILYEDDYLFVMNKPSGIAVHGGSSVGLGLIEAMRMLYPRLPHLELAHRLDLETSGCLILAKKRSILKELHELLREGKVVKKYFALTQGYWKKSELKVELPLLKNYLSSGERVVKVHKEGKNALTVFHVIEKYDDSTLIEAELHTGRTHQIRVHAQHQGHPIAGDDKYGNKDYNKKMRERGLKRLFLHSASVEFTLPSLDKTISVSAPLDEDLQKCLKNQKGYI